jgi:hypothetical protein
VQPPQSELTVTEESPDRIRGSWSPTEPRSDKTHDVTPRHLTSSFGTWIFCSRSETHADERAKDLTDAAKRVCARV